MYFTREVSCVTRLTKYRHLILVEIILQIFVLNYNDVMITECCCVALNFLFVVFGKKSKYFRLCFL